MVAEFEANLRHLRTREGMALAKKNGKLKGKQPSQGRVALLKTRRATQTSTSPILEFDATVWDPPHS